eukprot:scaffold33395_cov62-Phaeocystis_antarctica.AAC.11
MPSAAARVRLAARVHHRVVRPVVVLGALLDARTEEEAGHREVLEQLAVDVLPPRDLLLELDAAGGAAGSRHRVVRSLGWVPVRWEDAVGGGSRANSVQLQAADLAAEGADVPIVLGVRLRPVVGLIYEVVRAEVTGGTEEEARHCDVLEELAVHRLHPRDLLLEGLLRVHGQLLPLLPWDSTRAESCNSADL